MLEWGGAAGQRPDAQACSNVRNTASPFWCAMLANPARRCLVPAPAFSKWTAAPDPTTRRKACKWFEVADAELFCFTGIWRPTEDGERFAFVTSEANAVVAPVHAKAMPVILETGDCGRWLTGDHAAVGAVRKPLDDGALRVRAGGVT